MGPLVLTLCLSVAPPSSPEASGGSPDAGRREEPPGAEGFDAFVGYLEWLFDAKLSEAQLTEGRERVDTAWKARDASEEQLVTRAVELEAELGHYSQAELLALRSSVEDEYVKTLKRRNRGQKLAQWILALRVTARAPIAAGVPPLTRQSADCLAELLVFVARELGTAPSAVADGAFRDAFARALASGYKRLAPEEKSAITLAPAKWARLRRAWRTVPAFRREELRTAWRSGFGLNAAADAAGFAALAPRVAASISIDP